MLSLVTIFIVLTREITVANSEFTVVKFGDTSTQTTQTESSDFTFSSSDFTTNSLDSSPTSEDTIFTEKTKESINTGPTLTFNNNLDEISTRAQTESSDLTFTSSDSLDSSPKSEDTIFTENTEKSINTEPTLTSNNNLDEFSTRAQTESSDFTFTSSDFTTNSFDSSPTTEETIFLDIFTGKTENFNTESTLTSTKLSTTVSEFETSENDLMETTSSMNSEKTFTSADIPFTPTLKSHRVFIFMKKIVVGRENLTSEWSIKSDHPIDFIQSKLKLILNCNSSNTDEAENVNNPISYRTIGTNILSEYPKVYLNKLSEYTNYSCVARLTDENYKELDEQFFEITTLQSVPSDVNFTITEINSRNLTIEWSRPFKLHGTLRSYYIQLNDLGPQHFIRSECGIPSSTRTIPIYTEEENIKIILEKLNPNFEYEIIVLAENEAGNSSGTPQVVQTNNSTSTPPLNVSTTITNISNNCNGTNYNSSVHIYWELPCNTNGALEEFRVDLENEGSLETWWVPRNEEIEDLNYFLYVWSLKASTSYQIIITPISEEKVKGEVTIIRTEDTPEGCPSNSIEIKTNNLTSTQFNITWEGPRNNYGKILQYFLEIETLDPSPKHYYIADGSDCPEFERRKYVYAIEQNNFYLFKLAMPDFNYRIRIKAQTSAGFGEFSDYKYVTTKAISSTPVRNMNITVGRSVVSSDSYEFKVFANFKQPCNTNGPFEKYVIKVIGQREGPYKNDMFTYTQHNFNSTSNNDITLKKPEYNYTFTTEVITNGFTSSVVTSYILTESGVPPINPKKVSCSIHENAPTQIDITMNKELFSDDNGNVLYYSIMFAKTEMKTLKNHNSSYGLWKNDQWPEVKESEMYPLITKKVIQVTPKFWNPFRGAVKETRISIGKIEDCDFFCETLEEDTNYILVFRGFTKSMYSDLFIIVKTGKTNTKLGAVLTFSILAIIVISIGISLYYFRRKKLWLFKSISETVISTEESHLKYSVPVKSFISYYHKITNDPTLLRKQYEEIEDETKIYKEKCVNTVFALKTENRRKNRYTNILPYDEYRVKLNIDEDDENCTDYINASYIRGNSDKVEYIATQGPLEHTSRDFWKMVIQENVSVIVMVSMFVEKDKEKCYKYFPNNHETMLISEDIEVKCLSELHLGHYYVRNLLVRKDIKQFSVIHIQYLDWPDFGCPKYTKNLLSFCREIRDRINFEKGLMIIHCSAGVGRTGTLISLDILLQQINDGKEISVFETVMELRRQRTHMVQTEKQYVYLHTCIKDALENPCGESKTHEPIYENAPLKNKKCIKQNESAF